MGTAKETAAVTAETLTNVSRRFTEAEEEAALSDKRDAVESDEQRTREVCGGREGGYLNTTQLGGCSTPNTQEDAGCLLWRLLSTRQGLRVSDIASRQRQSERSPNESEAP